MKQKKKLLLTKTAIDEFIVEMAILQEDLSVAKTRDERDQIKELFLALKSRVNKLHQVASLLLKKIDINDKAVLEVRGIIYPGVTVEICNVSLSIDKIYKNVKLSLSKDSGKIVIEYI